VITPPFSLMRDIAKKLLAREEAVELLIRKCENAEINEHRQDGKNEDNPKNQDFVRHPAHFPDHLSDITAFFFRGHSLLPPSIIIRIIACSY